ncbi:MAG: hypothetical protein ABI895_24675 [Deltaproteobacteria bacterium]
MRIELLDRLEPLGRDPDAPHEQELAHEPKNVEPEADNPPIFMPFDVGIAAARELVATRRSVLPRAHLLSTRASPYRALETPVARRPNAVDYGTTRAAALVERGRMQQLEARPPVIPRTGMVHTPRLRARAREGALRVCALSVCAP